MALPQDDDKTDPHLQIPASFQKKDPPPRLQPVPPLAPTGTPLAPATTDLPPPKMPQLGILEPYMVDPSITEVMVNDTRNIMIEREGRLTASNTRFESIDELNRITRNILDITGRILSPDQPYVDVMMPDGSRVNIVGPPLTLRGPCITIRKFPTRSLSLEDLMRAGTLDRKMAFFLSLVVMGRLNLLICGGTGAGKSTLLNALLKFVPKQERLIIIEDTPELQLEHINSVRLQTKPQTPGSPSIPARELVANALRMRPDRIVVGECRRGEAFDMIQAMNTGHEGSMTTIHSNSPRDSLARLETLALMGAPELPLAAIRRQVASTIDVIVQLKRMRDGSRRIAQISELTGMEGDAYTLQDIYTFDPQTGSSDRKGTGQFKVSGLVPTVVERLRDLGFEVPHQLFE